jgi:hypothetical protein
MVAHGRLGPSIAAVCAAILFGACGSVGAPTAAPTVVATSNAAAPTVAPTVAPTAERLTPPPPTPLPSPRIYGPVTVVTGTETCTFDFVNGTTTTKANSAEHMRNGTATCTDRANDPRVSGTYVATWNIDYWGTADHSNGALVQWGTATLTTPGGTWVGRATGVYSSDRGDTIVAWWTGTGAYKGLTYFSVATGGGPWEIQGQIFPGSPPNP